MRQAHCKIGFDSHEPVITPLARSGKRQEAVSIVREIEASGEYVNPYYHAFPYIALGEHERALKLLEEAVDTSVEQLAWFSVEPSLDPLRATPGFQAQAKRLGRPPFPPSP